MIVEQRQVLLWAASMSSFRKVLAPHGQGVGGKTVGNRLTDGQAHFYQESIAHDRKARALPSQMRETAVER